VTAFLLLLAGVCAVIAGLFTLDPNGGGWHKVVCWGVVAIGLLLAGLANHFAR